MMFSLQAGWEQQLLSPQSVSPSAGSKKKLELTEANQKVMLLQKPESQAITKTRKSDN
jgi:hypothetical protein